MRAIVRACMCVRVAIFSNDSRVGLGYDSGVFGTILCNMLTYAHSIHGLCSLMPIVSTGYAHLCP